MADGPFYRGGASLRPRPGEVRLDQKSGMVLPLRGVSVFDRPDNLNHFGGAYLLENVPDNLRIVQRGKNRHHYEIVPAYPMEMADYEDALEKVTLAAV